MHTHEFDTTAELEDVEQRLARGSMHPVYADLGTDAEPGSETTGNFNPSRVADLERQNDRFVVWNNRDDRRSYIGSDRYELIQHREVIDAIRSAVSETVGEIDKGVVRDYGSRVDGVLVFGNQEDARVDVEDLVDGYVPPEGAEYVQDRLGLGMRFKNSWDGGTKVFGSTMGYRYICQNWMVWGEEEIGSVDQLHVHQLNADFFADIIQDVFDLKDEVEQIVVDSNGEEFPAVWAPTILEGVGFGRNYRIGILEIVDDWDRETLTLWDLYQAATTYLDHDRVEEIGNGVYDSHQQRAWDVLSADFEAPDEEPENLAEVL